MAGKTRLPKPTARSAAVSILGAVIRKRRPLDEAWKDALTTDGLSRLETRDRAFARALVATSLRRLGQIDAILGQLLESPLPAKASRAQDILRLGVCQIAFMGISPHAAVDEAVTLAGSNTATQPYKGLINAVLRRLAGERAALLETQDEAYLNTPDWLWQGWSSAYGAETARAIARAHLADPPLDITVKDPATDWADRLQAERLPTGSLRRSTTDITTLPGFEEGAWWVQDAAAALPATLLGAVTGRTVLDLCAAPGGKTAQLAAQGANVIAVDRSENRLKIVSENLGRLGLDATLVAADATAWRPDAPADAILLDAPCSATGTIRRHPDVAHLKRPDDIDTLVTLQDRLLEAAMDMLAPGGTLVYCTCSLQPEEGPERIARLLDRMPGIARKPIAPAEIGDLSEAVTAEGDLRTLPCHLAAQGGLDGFFAARLIRPH